MLRNRVHAALSSSPVSCWSGRACTCSKSSSSFGHRATRLQVARPLACEKSSSMARWRRFHFHGHADSMRATWDELTHDCATRDTLASGPIRVATCDLPATTQPTFPRELADQSPRCIIALQAQQRQQPLNCANKSRLWPSGSRRSLLASCNSSLATLKMVPRPRDATSDVAATCTPIKLSISLH